MKLLPKMTRLQWFEITKFSHRELKRLTDRLLDEKYDNKRGWGYQVSEARRQFLTGRFIEKEKRIETITDPFGKTQSFEIFVYREIIFRLQPEWPQLQIENPPRNLGPFFTSIGEYLNFEVGISEIRIAPTDWIQAFQKKFSSTKVVKAQINNIIVSNSSSAALLIAGSEDVQKHFRELTRGRKYNLSSAQMEFFDNGVTVKFEVNESARVKIISANEQHSSAFFREFFLFFKG